MIFRKLLQALNERLAPNHQQEQPQIFEVGSPEYNAQIVSMVRTLNEQLAERGQRLPEKTAIDIIRLTSEE